MKKLLLASFILIWGFLLVSAQCPDSLYITTQSRIDSFQILYPNCTEIEGNVTIHGWNIVNLNGLNMLSSIGGGLSIRETQISTLTGFNNLSNVGGDLRIGGKDWYFGDCYGNPLLTSLTALNSLEYIGGDLIVSCNNSLTNLNGLEGLSSIGGCLNINFDDNITSLTGLEGLTYIGECITIARNDVLTSISALEGLVSLDLEYLSIQGNNSLASMTGLEGLNSTGGLTIYQNDLLTNLTGLEGLTSIGETLIISGNKYLSNCEEESVCAYLASPNGEFEIWANATGCNSQDEVLDSCEAHAGIYDNIHYKSELVLYPNPASQEVYISTDDGRIVNEIIIFTLTGQQVLKARPVNGKVDISHLQPGMYIVEVTIENTRLRQKLLVQR